MAFLVVVHEFVLPQTATNIHISCNDGGYTVKLRYCLEKLYPDLGSQQGYFGLDTKSLLAYSRKLQCSPKLQHLFGRSSQVAYRLQKIYNLGISNVTCNVRYVEQKKNQLIMFSLNVLQHFRFE